jgi:hypothetical protein
VYAASRVTTAFARRRSGRNLRGMLSHVLRPMSTALVAPAGAAAVTRAKYAISFGSRHGSAPAWPIPFARVAATISVSGGADMRGVWRSTHYDSGSSVCRALVLEPTLDDKLCGLTTLISLLCPRLEAARYRLDDNHRVRKRKLR